MVQSRQPRQFDAVVLHVRNFGESDRIVELLTPDEGRIATLARGARASKKRFAGALDLFVSLRASVVPSGSLWTLHAADVSTARVTLRRDLRYLQRAATLCEVARLLLPERLHCRDGYEAVTTALDDLAAGNLAAAVQAYPKLLAAAGITPQLERCVTCGARGAPVARLDGEAGGALCAQCDGKLKPLHGDALRVIAGAACGDLHTAASVEHQMTGYIEQHLGRALRSRRVWA